MVQSADCCKRIIKGDRGVLNFTRRYDAISGPRLRQAKKGADSLQVSASRIEFAGQPASYRDRLELEFGGQELGDISVIILSKVGDQLRPQLSSPLFHLGIVTAFREQIKISENLFFCVSNRVVHIKIMLPRLFPYCFLHC